MEYEVYKIYQSEDFSSLTRGMKVAQCMGKSSVDTLTENTEEEILSKLEDLTISEKLFCSFCNSSFEDQTQQRLHYKLDWHRYNLKQKLNGLKSVTEEKFSQLADDDLSSISGSESESEDEEADSSDYASSSSKGGISRTEESSKRYEHLRLLAARHAKVFFENADGKILSLYRCLLHGKKDVPENDEQLVPLALKVAINPTWAIIMLGGGHFAAGIFQGKEVLVHKTFHCYTVRARQGGTQSSRDGRSGGSHPKSAGASLRRYNEAALIQHVQDIMDLWSSHFSNCSLILYRAVGHNRSVLFSGRNPPLNKTDSRLRTIPFATRRATFSEVKRIHDILSSVEVYGSAGLFQTEFPQSPKKRGSKSQAVDEDSSTSQKIANTDISNDSHVGTSTVGSEASSPKRPQSKRSIDRAKPRKSPHRPLPEIVTAILANSSSESDVSETLANCLVGEDVEMSFESLQEFEDTVPQAMKDKRKSRENKKSGKKKQVEKDVVVTPIVILRKKMWAACRLGDLDLLVNSIQSVQLVEEDSETAVEMSDCKIDDSVTVTSNDSTVTKLEYLRCLNENIGENKETLLHIAAQGGHMAIVRTLMEAGCDPCVINKKSQTPYIVSANKETRNVFRRFLADFPDKYDYTKSQISGPLTDEMEQKMAEKRREQRKAKKEREKERKKEDEARKEEETEKERFLKLSDREKRALAAERRLVSIASHGGMKPVISRCFQCAVDITGKVPFEYDIHRFCSIDCLKQHRLKTKNVQQKH